MSEVDKGSESQGKMQALKAGKAYWVSDWVAVGDNVMARSFVCVTGGMLTAAMPAYRFQLAGGPLRYRFSALAEDYHTEEDLEAALLKQAGLLSGGG